MKSALRKYWPFWIHVVVGGMLLWALRDSNPYSYYQVLGWVVFAYFGYLTVVFQEWGEKRVFWVLLLVAMIYNPFIKPKWGRSVWCVVNVMTLIPLGMAAPQLKRCMDS